MEIYNSWKKKCQNKSPAPCDVFTESNSELSPSFPLETNICTFIVMITTFCNISTHFPVISKLLRSLFLLLPLGATYLKVTSQKCLGNTDMGFYWSTEHVAMPQQWHSNMAVSHWSMKSSSQTGRAVAVVMRIVRLI